MYFLNIIIMKELLTLENFKECRKQPSRDAPPKLMLFQTILDFSNNLKEGTENFNKLLKRYK